MKSQNGLKRTGSKIIFGLISVVILLWTGYLTTSFLSMVLPASFWVVPYLGLVVFDGGMIGWMFVYLYLAEGSMQRAIALGLTVFNLIGVGLMTIAEIVLGGQTFTAAPEMLGTVAIWGVGIWTFVNVAGIVAFHLSSPDARIAAAIQEEKDAVVEDALTDLRNRRQDNAKQLSGILGGGMFKALVTELGADTDGDGVPDLAERPSNRGKADIGNYTYDTPRHELTQPTPQAGQGGSLSAGEVAMLLDMLEARAAQRPPVAQSVNGQHEPTPRP